MNMIAQLNQFFVGILLFLANIIKTVCNNPLFDACNEKNGQADCLLYPIEAYVKADKSVCNYCDKNQKLIDKEWSYKAATYIRGKKFSKQMLKLVAAIAKRHDIQNLYISLFIANTKTIRRITTDTTFFSYHLFLISNN